MRFATLADQAAVEAICNDPSIRPWTAPEGAAPCSAVGYLTNPSFAVLAEGEGCWLARYLGANRYVIHTNLLPHARGARAVELARQALAMAFVKTTAVELLTMVPGNLPHARMLARRMGFRHVFDRPAIWPVGEQTFDMEFYSLTIEDWVCSGACEKAGERFHARLHELTGEATHGKDPVHDAFVGAAIEMLLSGNIRKAVETYNRWAVFAMYQPVDLLSTEPLLIDIKQCVLRVEGDQFFVEADHA